MAWLVVLCLVISTLNLYFFFKKSMQKSFEQELNEFRTYTETLITEFNRVTTRNVSLLDERIDELDHKIRLSQKVDLLLKERFEEAHKIEFLKPLKLNELDKEKQEISEQNTVTTQKEQLLKTPYSIEKIEISEEQQKENNTEKNREKTPRKTIQKLIDIISFTEEKIEILEEQQEKQQKEKIVKKEENSKNNHIQKTINIEEPLLFEGLPIEKIKKHQSRLNTHKKQKLLLQYLQENKTKEELLNLGFNSNEINIAILCLSTESYEK